MSGPTFHRMVETSRLESSRPRSMTTSDPSISSRRTSPPPRSASKAQAGPPWSGTRSVKSYLSASFSTSSRTSPPAPFRCSCSTSGSTRTTSTTRMCALTMSRRSGTSPPGPMCRSVSRSLATRRTACWYCHSELARCGRAHPGRTPVFICISPNPHKAALTAPQQLEFS